MDSCGGEWGLEPGCPACEQLGQNSSNFTAKVLNLFFLNENTGFSGQCWQIFSLIYPYCVSPLTQVRP